MPAMANVRHQCGLPSAGTCICLQRYAQSCTCWHAGVSLVTDLAVSEGGSLQGAHALLENTLRQAKKVLEAPEVLLS